MLVALLAAATPRAVVAAERPGGGLTAGAAKVDIDVPPGTPLGGYGAFARRLPFPDVLGRHRHAFWFRPHDGRDSPVTARALVLSHGERRIVWIAADLIAVDRRLTAEVGERLERAFGMAPTVVMSASHTHSGPGAFGDSGVLGFVAVDRPDPEVRDAVVRALVDAARAADRRRVPARLGAARGTAPDVTRPRLAAPVDPEMLVMKIDGPDARPIALVWNFAIHPTMLGPRNLQLSADVTGAVSRALETALGVPVLFVNGAVGDVSPRRHGRAALTEVATALARTAQRLAAQAEARDVDAPAIATARVSLGRPSLTMGNCLRGWLPRALGLPLGSVFPSEATLTAVGIGDVAWVTMPGELQSSLGARIKDAARARWRHAFVAGLSNDYLGYFVDRASFRTPAYVTCASFYGDEAGERLTDAASALLRGLGEGR